MKEFEIFIPTTHPDGTALGAGVLGRIKQQLAEVFGGYTHMKQSSEGAWKYAGRTFYDEITIVKVLDKGDIDFDWVKFRQQLEDDLQQESVLIIERDVQIR